MTRSGREKARETVEGATPAAFATFGVAYVARPIGSFFMGHIGDRLGRRKVLLTTLLMMGVSTFLVDCLPTYGHRGSSGADPARRAETAPGALGLRRTSRGQLDVLRARARRASGFFTSFTLSGTQGGQVFAPAVFLPLAAILSDEQLQAWGWRIPFWLSAVVVLVGYVIRRNLEETPEFQAEAESHEAPRAPLAELFRDHWSSVVRVLFAAFIASVNTMFAVFALSFATSDDIGISKTLMLWVAIVANLVAIMVIPVWATLSDRIGRKQVFVTGALGSGVLAFFFLGAIADADGLLVFVLGVMLAGIVYSMPNAVWPATYAEYFPTSVRLSGMAIGTQFGFALAGFSPTIAESLLTPAMQVREGREHGLTVSYRVIDAGRLELGVDDLPELLDWAGLRRA